MFTKSSASVTYYVMHMAKHHKTRYEQSNPIELIPLKPPNLLRPWWNYLTPKSCRCRASTRATIPRTWAIGDCAERCMEVMKFMQARFCPAASLLAAYLVRTKDIQKQTIAKHKICKEETSENTTSEDRTTIALDQSDRSR